MSTFSKKYSLPHEPTKFIFLTWETGYKNLKIYSDGRLITTVSQPSVFTEGFYFKDEELGTIKLKFTTSRPLSLEVKVDGQTYYHEKARGDKEGFAGLVTTFWILFGFSILGICFAYATIFSQLNSLNSSIIYIALAIDLIILTIYAATAIYLNKRLGWAYFLGVTTFLITTSIYGINAANSFYGWSVGTIFIMVVRTSILIFMFTYFKNALIAVKNSGGDQRDELLDNL